MDKCLPLSPTHPSSLVKEWGKKEGFEFLLRKENWNTFEERIRVAFGNQSSQYDSINTAYQLAKDEFRNLERDSGIRYFEHLREVDLILIDYMGVRDSTLIVLALLHDLLEDRPKWDIWMVAKIFGWKISYLLWWLTEPDWMIGGWKMGEWFYHFRLRFAPRSFFIVKLADRLHNLITLQYHPTKKQIAKIKETIKYYLPYAKEYGILYEELKEVLSQLENLLESGNIVADGNVQ